MGYRHPSPLDWIALACATAALLSPWVIGVVPARLDESFGYQSLACWAMAASIVVAILARDTRMSIAAVFIADAALVGWYVWAAWLVTTSAFSQQGYPFVPRT